MKSLLREGSARTHLFHLGCSNVPRPHLLLPAAPLPWCWQAFTTQLHGELLQGMEPAEINAASISDCEHWMNKTHASIDSRFPPPSLGYWWHIIHEAHNKLHISRHILVCIYSSYRLVSILISFLPGSVSPLLFLSHSYLIPWHFKIVCWLRFFEILQRAALMQFWHYFCLERQDRRNKHALEAHLWATFWEPQNEGAFPGVKRTSPLVCPATYTHTLLSYIKHSAQIFTYFHFFPWNPKREGLTTSASPGQIHQPQPSSPLLSKATHTTHLPSLLPWGRSCSWFNDRFWLFIWDGTFKTRDHCVPTCMLKVMTSTHRAEIG